MFFNISKQYRHLQRYRRIAEILIKNGFGALVETLDLKQYLPMKKRFSTENDAVKKLSLAERLNRVLQELGPTYIKFGQLLSTRADLLPPDYIIQLRKLQDKVEAISYPEIEKVLIEEFGEDYKRKFSSIDEEPQAAASIAQTHRAVLYSGEDVILKIRKPGIKKTVDIDLEILRNLARIAEERGLVSININLTKIIEEFRETIIKELNFKNEVYNIEKFTANFKEEEDIKIPLVYKELSTSQILTLEEIKGVKLNEIDNMEVVDFDRQYLARLGAEALMQQILIDGFFHADPHPGNIFIVDGRKLAYIDFGMMGRLTVKDRDKLSILFIALLNKNVEIVVDTLLDIGSVDRKIKRRKFKLAVEELFDKYYGMELENIDFSMVVNDIENLLFSFHIRIPEDYFLLFRSIGISEGVGFNLDPSFNMVETAQDFLNRLIMDRLKPSNIMERVIKKVWKGGSILKALPLRLNDVLIKFIEDDFTIGFKHLNIEPLIEKLDIISNRISISMIISALIMGSSIIMQTDLKPLVYGIPLLGFLGYCIAGVMGIWLIIDIIRSGKY